MSKQTPIITSCAIPESQVVPLPQALNDPNFRKHNMTLVNAAANEFFSAARRGDALPPSYLGKLDYDQGVQIQLAVADRYEINGIKRIGWKVAATNKAVQAQIGVDEPAFGSLRDKDVLWSGGVLPLGKLSKPHLECELCFRFNERITNAATSSQILEAIDFVYPAFEFIEKRTPMSDLPLALADNVEHTGIILGRPIRPPVGLAFKGVVCKLSRSGEELASASGEAVLGDPINAIAWLQRALAKYGQALQKDQLVMTGSFVPQLPVGPGELLRADFSDVGHVEIHTSH